MCRAGDERWRGRGEAGPARSGVGRGSPAGRPERPVTWPKGRGGRAAPGHRSDLPRVRPRLVRGAERLARLIQEESIPTPGPPRSRREFGPTGVLADRGPGRDGRGPARGPDAQSEKNHIYDRLRRTITVGWWAQGRTPSCALVERSHWATQAGALRPRSRRISRTVGFFRHGLNRPHEIRPGRRTRTRRVLVSQGGGPSAEDGFVGTARSRRNPWRAGRANRLLSLER